MSTDKRSVHTDALETLGTILGENEKRDAIHLAVEPVVAAGRLVPGSHVGFTPNGQVDYSHSPVGIVDPFLKADVQRGERFWLIVYPRQITSLRHVWTHPAFDDVEVKPEPKSMSSSELWLRNFADNLGVTYDRLIEHAGDYIKYDSIWVSGGDFEGEYIPDEFWGHYEAVTGLSVDEDVRGNFLGCSC